MDLIVEIVAAPFGLVWQILTTWWFWAVAGPASLVALAVMYRRELTAYAQAVLVTASDVMHLVLPVVGNLWTAAGNRWTEGLDALFRGRQNGR